MLHHKIEILCPYCRNILGWYPGDSFPIVQQYTIQQSTCEWCGHKVSEIIDMRTGGLYDVREENTKSI